MLSKLVGDLVSQVKTSAEDEGFGFAGASKFQGVETSSSSQYHSISFGGLGRCPIARTF